MKETPAGLRRPGSQTFPEEGPSRRKSAQADLRRAFFRAAFFVPAFLREAFFEAAFLRRAAIAWVTPLVVAQRRGSAARGRASPTSPADPVTRPLAGAFSPRRSARSLESPPWNQTLRHSLWESLVPSSGTGSGDLTANFVKVCPRCGHNPRL